MKSMDTGPLKIELVSAKIYNLKEKTEQPAENCVSLALMVKKKKKTLDKDRCCPGGNPHL